MQSHTLTNDDGTSPAKSFEVRIAKGKVISGPRAITLRQGETITLRLVSDREGEVHVHGYDLHVRLRPNEPTTLTFVAKLTGRFAYELHRPPIELGVLEVYPR